MASAFNALQPLCPTPSADLVAYFDHFRIADYADPLIGLLPLADAIAISENFRTFHPLASAFGLVFLDDANTSNHHCYITQGPLKGCILYLNHDGDNLVVFKSLNDYLDAVKSALETGVDFDSLHHDDAHWKVRVTSDDQGALAKAIEELLQAKHDEKVSAQLLVYIAALDLANTRLLEKLARHDDLYVAEAVGNAIWKAPRRELVDIAAIVSQNQYHQVAEAGKRALAAITGST